MASWNALLDEFAAVPDQEKGDWLRERQKTALAAVGALRGGRNVMVYGSAFLQKSWAPADQLMITYEDINGLMSVIYQMDTSKGLTLLLHTPGGVTNAAETIVAYLRQKFPSADDFEVVIPTLAMSAGTMISLASNRIIMGRQSQLGPIDPQLAAGNGRQVSARAIVEQFERARDDVLTTQAAAHAWAPILASMGPALLQEAQNALDYSESMVADWLARWMVSTESDPAHTGRSIAHHFNDASRHKSHGRRIDRDEARSIGVTVEDLEDNQELQEAVLTSYHLLTIMFEQSATTKFLFSDVGRTWLKNVPVGPA